MLEKDATSSERRIVTFAECWGLLIENSKWFYDLGVERGC